ncbi:MAG: glutaredoxin domain-containing protein [Thermoleophilia bacterium]
MTDAGGETRARRLPAVALYTLSGCGHCERARELLRRRGVAFSETRGDGRPHFRRELRELTGRSTVPQIMVDGEGIGGASDLARLDRRGLLEPLLQGAHFPHAVVRRRLSPVGLLSVVVGGGCGPWRYAVELVERDGSVSRRLPAPEAMAHELASAFNAGDDPASSAAGPDHPTRPGG